MVSKNYFHRLQGVKNIDIQNNYIFIDTESKTKIINEKTKENTFYLGCAIFYNRSHKLKVEKTYYKDSTEFWNDIEVFRIHSYNLNNEKDLFWFAHNSEFDFMQLKGFENLTRLGFELKSLYAKNRVFILLFEKYDKKIKKKFRIHIWDTTNFVSYSLKKLGKNVGLEKLEVDFDKVNDKELEIYCKRDTEIIYQFITKYLNFLEVYQLSKLKATASSVAFSTFRHKFYDIKRQPIFIHNFKQCIKLERESYRGGITDNFKVGICESQFKTDINSMYPKEMKDNDIPVKLIAYIHNSTEQMRKKKGKKYRINNILQKQFDKYCRKFESKEKALMFIYNKLKKDYHIIAKVKCYINKKNAYLLSNYRYETSNSKLCFAYGVFTEVFCTPELNFLERKGKIIEIYELAIYEKKNIFREYIDFFYSLRKQFKIDDNKVYVEICKLFMNTLYGKFGQKDFEQKTLELTDKFIIKYQDLIMIMIENYMKKNSDIQNKGIIYLGKIVNSYELYIVNGKFYGIKELEKNSKESFVAISSFITSYARMKLVKFLKIAKRKNTSYTDTDSLFVNLEGYLNLFKYGYINRYKKYDLGMLKVEGYGKGVFYVPKFYDFYDLMDKSNKGKLIRKVKGINQEKSNVLNETNEYVEYSISKWIKFKSSLKEGYLEKQYIIDDKKIMSKIYNKGKVNKYNEVQPYSIQELQELYPIK